MGKSKRRRWNAVADRVKPKSVGAEVGVYKGRMSNALFKLIPGLTLFMVDRWKPYSKAEQKASPKTRIAKIKRKSKWKAIYASAKNVARRHKHATIIKGDSAKAADRFADGSLDFVFIDGDHSYEGVKRDIAAWLPKVKRYGWLMGHDYGSKPDGGVRKAVDELGLKVERDCDHVWAIKVLSKKMVEEALENESVQVQKQETVSESANESEPGKAETDMGEAGGGE